MFLNSNFLRWQYTLSGRIATNVSVYLVLRFRSRVLPHDTGRYMKDKTTFLYFPPSPHFVRVFSFVSCGYYYSAQLHSTKQIPIEDDVLVWATSTHTIQLSL